MSVSSRAMLPLIFFRRRENLFFIDRSFRWGYISCILVRRPSISSVNFRASELLYVFSMKAMKFSTGMT